MLAENYFKANTLCNNRENKGWKSDHSVCMSVLRGWSRP